MNKFNILKKWKLIYALFHQLFIYIFSEIFEFDNIFIIIAINVLIYIIPYYISLYQIRNNKIDNIKFLSLSDLLYYLIPSIIVCPIYESLAVIMTKQANETNGLFSITNILIYLFLYILFLLLYKIELKKTQKHSK